MSVLEQVFAFLRDQIIDHWVKFLSGFAVLAIGWFLGKRRARSEWKRKTFYDRLNVSLNIIEPGKPLRIRTLLEKSCQDVFLNKVAVETVIAAGQKTSERNPILPLPKDDYWYYLNAVLNELAERFATGEVKRDLGVPVVTKKYLICLTSEVAGDLRTRKLRAMVIGKELLESLPADPPEFERPWHHNRWDTLKAMALAWRERPHQFLEMEISV
jgi:hypothetical protein